MTLVAEIDRRFLIPGLYSSILASWLGNEPADRLPQIIRLQEEQGYLARKQTSVGQWVMITNKGL